MPDLKPVEGRMYPVRSKYDGAYFYEIDPDTDEVGPVVKASGSPDEAEPNRYWIGGFDELATWDSLRQSWII